MADVFATITEADAATLERLVGAMELRAAQPKQRAMLASYLAELHLPPAARILEVGCGSGAIARFLAARPGVAEVIGVDPSPFFVARARELALETPRTADAVVQADLRFEVADGRSLGLGEQTFDAVVIHTVLTHVPGPELMLAEAHRVLRPGGSLALFEGDNSTASVAIGNCDPLQACVDAAVEALVHDRWIVRRISHLVQAAGFTVHSFRGHSYIDTEASYMMTLVDRGADFLVAWGRIGAELASELKTEARRRCDRSVFFGHISYASLVAQRPV